MTCVLSNLVLSFSKEFLLNFKVPGHQNPFDRVWEHLGMLPAGAIAMREPSKADSTILPTSSPRHVTASGLTELLDLSPDALIVVDQAGTITQSNEQATSLFGYHPQEMLGQRLEMLLPDRFRAQHTTHREHYFTAPRMRTMGAGLQLYGLRKDGTEFPVDISLRPVLLDDTPLTIAAVRDVSDQKRSERERIQQAAQLRLQAELIDRAHDAILVRDPTSRIIFWNKGAQDLYGWSQEEVLGRVTHSLLQTVFPISVAAADAQLEREGYWEGELIHTRHDGSVVVVESRQALLRDEKGQLTAILEINRDITHRRQLEQLAQAAHSETVAHLQFLQQLLDAIPSSVYLVYGQEARLLLANRAARSVWGADWPIDQPMQEFLSANAISVYTAQGRLLTGEEFATLRVVQGGEAIYQKQETIRRPDGSLLPVLVNAVALEAIVPPTVLRRESAATTQPLTSTSGELVALVVHQDVSALKEAEYLKDEFIAVAAHELRNPLSALKGFADMLIQQTARGKGPALADWQQDVLGEIEQATTRLDKLTEDLLDVTRLQAGRLALSRKPIDLVAVARYMVTQTHMTTQRHTLTFQTPLSSLSMHVDRVRIEQVLANLLSNAVKYSPQGGSIEVTLREEAEPHIALLSVRDHGIGIPASQQARMFGRFVRAENARASEITGTGLGLYLSRELVELHGGHLWFESTEGEGTTFFLMLPLT